ncbi:MAG: hypothetical protein JWN91_2094 [Nocardioides sp.]|nr:hypothetical protein [Nocardioides sp.]
MKTVWKVLLGLVLVVPLGAYVAGSLAASASDDPAPRHTIQINEPSPTPTTTPSTTPSAPVSATPEDGDVEVITPDYDDLGDDHGGDDHGGHGGGDDSGGGGSGGGGSDNSGHGGGGDDG